MRELVLTDDAGKEYCTLRLKGPLNALRKMPACPALHTRGPSFASMYPFCTRMLQVFEA